MRQPETPDTVLTKPNAMVLFVWIVLLATHLAAASPPEIADPQVSQHMKRAEDAIQRKELVSAVEEYKAVIALRPDLAEAHARLGMVHQDLGHLAESENALERALQLDPSLPRVGVLLALTYLKRGTPQKAIFHLERAYKNEKEVRIRVFVGQRLVEALSTLGKMAEALSCIQELRLLAPDDADVLYTASKLYASLWQAAVQRMLARHPESYRVHQVFAEILETQEKFCDAASEYRQILKTESSLPGMHYRLGRMILRCDPSSEGQKQALVEFHKELALDPMDVLSRVEIGDILLTENQAEEATRQFQSALELQPSLTKAYLGLGRALLAQRRYRDALDPFKKALQQAPDDESVHYNLMTLYRKLGRVAEARQANDQLQEIKRKKQASTSTMLDRIKGLPIHDPKPEP